VRLIKKQNKIKNLTKKQKIMSLNFDYTCPIINENISEFQSETKYFLKELVKGYYLYTDEKKEESIEWYTKKIYKVFEIKFEGVRGANEDMRAAADNQLDELGEKLDELETENTKLDEKVNELETEKKELETEKTELETEKTELETEKTELEEQLEKLETKIDGLEEEIIEYKEMLN
jgi:chromosome segregation ATPase